MSFLKQFKNNWKSFYILYFKNLKQKEIDDKTDNIYEIIY